MAKFMALSHSRLSDFNQCPRKFKLKYIDKAANFQMDQKDKSVHLVRGDNVHKALENYLIKMKTAGEGASIPKSSLDEVNETRPYIDKLAQIFGLQNLHPEAQVSINKDWQQVEWFDRSSYYRAIMDLIAKGENNVVVTDYKTGKFREYTPSNGMGQLELTAAICFSIWPEIDEVRTQYAFVDHKKLVSKDYNRKDDAERMKVHFIREHEKVNAEKTFDPSPNEFCKWCEATKDQCPISRRL